MVYTFTDNAKEILMGNGLIAADATSKDFTQDTHLMDAWLDKTLELGIGLDTTNRLCLIDELPECNIFKKIEPIESSENLKPKTEEPKQKKTRKKKTTNND